MQAIITGFNPSDRTGTIEWDKISHQVLFAIPTGGHVVASCHIRGLTGLAWRLELERTIDIKGNEAYMIERLPP